MVGSLGSVPLESLVTDLSWNLGASAVVAGILFKTGALEVANVGAGLLSTGAANFGTVSGTDGDFCSKFSSTGAGHSDFFRGVVSTGAAGNNGACPAVNFKGKEGAGFEIFGSTGAVVVDDGGTSDSWDFVGNNGATPKVAFAGNFGAGACPCANDS